MKKTTLPLFLLTALVAAQTYQYDAAGRLTGVAYSSGRTIRYTYDAADNLTQVETSATTGPSTRRLQESPGGAQIITTNGTAGQSSGGYAMLQVDSGEPPYGVAIFSLVQNGAVVFEAGVPASPPTTRTRVFIDRRNRVRSLSGQFEGEVTVDTGIAVVNPGRLTAQVRYTLRDSGGLQLTSGQGAIEPGRHFAQLIGDLSTVARGFSLPADFATAVRFGSLSVESDQPLSVTALRLTINQRNELLFTSTPVVDLETAATSGPVHFPHLAEGGGFSSSFVLLNTSMQAQNGSLDFLGDDGAPLHVSLTDGRSGSTFAYAIPAGGVATVETTGASAAILGGWARATPAAGQSTPAGAGSFRFGQGGILVTESGVSSARPTTLARVYVDTTGGHDTGLALANPGSTPLAVTLRAFEMDGRTAVGSAARVEVAAGAHVANQAGAFVAGLPNAFRGVVEIDASSPFVALTVRSLRNSRGELLFATLPVADFRRAAPSPVIFPHIADGGGFRTELIVLGTAGSAGSTMTLFADDGTPLPVIRP